MNGITWNAPDALWLLWLVPVLAASAIFAHARTRRAADTFAGGTMADRLMPRIRRSAAVTKTLVFLAGLTLAIVALARPAWDYYYETIQAKGVDLVVVLDVSRSMLADDGGEPRLERAKSVIASLVERLGGDRVGLLLFAGQVLPACPLTLDRGFFLQSLKAASPEAVGRGGTQVGPALEAAAKMLDTGGARDQLVLLATDAGDQDSFPETAAGHLAEKKIRVIALGIGRTSSGNEPLVINGLVVRDKKGQPVPARVNDELLASIASKTDGLAVPPDAARRLPELYARYIDPLRKGEAQEMHEKHYYERFQWFLLPGIILLLVQAGRGAYRRRGGIAGAAKAAGLLLVVAGALTSCGDDEDQAGVRRAASRLHAGDAKSALLELSKVADARKDEPILDYDLGCVQQALDDADKARLAYGRAIERGPKSLRARAYVNLALLDVAAMEKAASGDPATVAKELRTEVLAKADAALDRLQRARELDPALEAAPQKQDVLARWVRQLEDAWAARDREEARKKRAEQKGLHFLKALIEEEQTLLAEVSGRDLLQNLALRQRDVVADLPVLKEKTKDNLPAVPEGFSDELAAAIDACHPLLEAAAKDLASGRTAPAAQALARARAGLETVLALWGPPDEILGAIAAEHGAVVATIPPLMAAEASPRRDEAASQLAKVERDVVLSLVEILIRRLGAKTPDPSWSPLFLGFASKELPVAKSRIEELLAALPLNPKDAVSAGLSAAASIQALQEDWRLSALEATQLAKALEASVHGLEDHLGEVDPVAAALGAEAKPAIQLADLARRLDYLDPALTAAFTPPEKGDGAEPTPEEKKRAEEGLQAVLALKAGATEAVVTAKDRVVAASGAVDDETLAALGRGREALRWIWLGLVSFDEGLKSAVAEEQGALAANRQAAELLGKKDDRVPQPVSKGALSLRSQAREQRLADALVLLLRERLPAEMAAHKSKESDPQHPGTETPESMEAKALGEAMVKVQKLIGDAAESTARAAKGLTEKKDEDVPERMKAVLSAVEPDQERAALLLAEALAEIERARLGAGQLAQRIMNLDLALVLPARDLAAGREAASLDGKGKFTIADLATAQESAAGPFVARLGSSLERDLAKRKPSPAEGQPVPEEKLKEFEQISQTLLGFRAQVEEAHGRALEKLKAGETPAGRDAIGDTLTAARRLWLPFSDFKSLLEQAIREESSLVQRSRDLSGATESVPQDRKQGASSDQTMTRELIPILTQQIEAEAKKPQADGVAPPGSPSAPSSGLPKEVIDLAKKNLPLADTAIAEGLKKLGIESWSEAATHQEEARRLLEEILKKLEEKKDKKQEPQSGQEPQPMSQDEQERLARAVEERSRKLKDEHQKPRRPTAVEEDW